MTNKIGISLLLLPFIFLGLLGISQLMVTFLWNVFRCSPLARKMYFAIATFLAALWIDEAHKLLTGGKHLSALVHIGVFLLLYGIVDRLDASISRRIDENKL